MTWGASLARRPTWGHLSYSQQGEDLIVSMLFERLGLTRPTYLDIGAAHAMFLSNTYFFYEKGSRGVLVEPNPVLCKELRVERPGDIVLQAGIRFTDATEADYYMIGGPHGENLNTFSKDWAENARKGRDDRFVVEKVVKMPLLDINDVIARHFVGAPDFVNLDAEGVDYDILRRLDFGRFRPVIFCIEAPNPDTLPGDTKIPDLMHSKDYAICGGTYVNTIFVARERVAGLDRKV